MASRSQLGLAWAIPVGAPEDAPRAGLALPGAGRPASRADRVLRGRAPRTSRSTWTSASRCQARRGGARAARRLLARGERPQGAAPARCGTLERASCPLRDRAPEAVPALLDELEAVSDAWLAKKHTREKRFSLGCFDARLPAPLPARRRARRGAHRRLRELWPSGDLRGALDRPDALRRRGAPPA